MSADQEGEPPRDGRPYLEEQDGVAGEDRTAGMEPLGGIVAPYQVSQELEDWRRASVDTVSYEGMGQRRKTWPSAELEAAADVRQQIVQEKNRLAQRRFRERQKAKVQDLHTQIDDLKTKVDVLEMQNAALQGQNKILEKVLVMRAEQIHVLQDDYQNPNMKGREDQEPQATTLTLSALKGQPVQITCEILKKMSPEELTQLWQSYVTEISAALVNANSETPGAVARIEQLTKEICMATLDLSEEQKIEIMELRKMLLRKLQHLVEERGRLNLTIQTSLPTSMVGHKISLEYLKANQTVLRLREILRSEHNTMLDFICTTIKKVLKPLQVARLMVQAYPSKPDMLAVASAIVIDLGEDVSIHSRAEPPNTSPVALDVPGHFQTHAPALIQSVGPAVNPYHSDPCSLNAQPAPGGIIQGSAQGTADHV